MFKPVLPPPPEGPHVPVNVPPMPGQQPGQVFLSKVPEGAPAPRQAEKPGPSVVQEGAGRMRRGVSHLWQHSKSWVLLADADDEALHNEVLNKRREKVAAERRRHSADQKRLRDQIRQESVAGRTHRVSDLTGALSALSSVAPEKVEDEDVTPREVARHRRAQQAARCAAVAAGAYGGVTMLPEHPALLLGALAAGLVAAWRAGREDDEAEEETALRSEPTGPHQVIAEAAAGGPVDLTKGEEPQVRGADDLITALVKAQIITESERGETSVVGLRTDGPGWTATIELPGGRTAEQAIDKLGPLASALKVKASRIEMKADTGTEGHEGRFTMWVADADNPFAGNKNPSPLLQADVWDFWKDGAPLGRDARMVRQTLHLMWSSLLIGGLQDYGKSYLARLIAAAAALDPHLRIILITGKPGPDWAPLKKIAHAYIAGASPDRLAQVHETVDDLIADMQSRGEKLERLSEEDPASCPQGKLTPELSRKPGMERTLLIVDELQELLDAAANTKVKVAEEDEDGKGARSRSGKDVLVENFARFVRVARFVGGKAVFITQRPDSDSVPTKLREVCVKKACFRVKGMSSAKMVLGDEAVAAGAAPHKLLEHHKGVVVLDQGAESGHVTLLGDVIEIPEFREIVDRAYDLRVKAGTLSGQAASRSRAEEAAARTDAVRADAVEIFDRLGVPATQGLTAEALAEALAEAHPGRYGGLDAAGLRERLRKAGITTVKIVSFPEKGRLMGFKRHQLDPSAGASEAA